MTFVRKKFGKFADFRNGINYVDGNKGEVAKVVGVGDFQEKSELTDFDSLKKIRLSGTLAVEDELKDGDLLFVRSNGSKNLIGRCVVIRNPPNKVTFSGFTIRARIDAATALPDYISLVFREENVKRQLSIAGGGNGNISNLSQGLLSALDIDLPDLSVQKALTKFYGEWNAGIEKMNRLIKAKADQKNAYMQLLLTGRNRLEPFRGAWSQFCLGDLFDERSERGHGHLPLLSITREEGVVPRSDDLKDTSSEDKSKYLRICPGDIGYNTMRMWQGVSALSSLEGIVSPAYTVCTPKKHVDGQFMAYLFKLPQVINLFYRYSQGLTSDTWNLKYRHFQEIKVMIPKNEEQKAIANLLNACDEEIALLKSQADALHRQKRGLMQKLLAGEWRVDFEKEKLQ